jgi:Mn-dependent DtxR family transcriptional regulator
MITKEYYGPILKQLVDFNGSVKKIARRTNMSIPLVVSRLEDLKAYSFIDYDGQINGTSYVALTDTGRKRAREIVDAS